MGDEFSRRRLLAGRVDVGSWDGMDDALAGDFDSSTDCDRELFDATLVIWTSRLQADEDVVVGAPEEDAAAEVMAAGRWE